MSATELDRTVGLLVRQVGHWQQPRWAAGADGGDGSRADHLHRLVQKLADLGADAEGGPRRRVPRLANDLALVDQLRVVAADLVAAAPPKEVLARAAAEVAATRDALGAR
ncbi:hypothetical protein [Micromonospora halophytica]|uniref:Uncharacterized protein n=1 Tax=Micromonospora halophytica TaxID=47864 RepID=A0A1C5H8L2_9ACTN|nr:hypothetical protein [Micromonospora halophytica]SCG42237.1 hypothetical protein GA0070560_103267 [Micromonospora halophytica]